MTVYRRRNPLLMTVMGANPGPSFVVIESDTGTVVYTKRATGMGNQAISACVEKARKFADKTGRSYIVFLDIQGLRTGMRVSVPMVRALGITEEIHPRGNPRRPRRPDDPVDKAIEQAWYRLMSGVQVSVMDIPKIFRDVKLEMAAGMPLEEAVARVGSRYRVNRNPGLFASAVGGMAGAVVASALSNPRRRIRANMPARVAWDRMTDRQRIWALGFAGVPREAVDPYVPMSWQELPAPIRRSLQSGWRRNPAKSPWAVCRAAQKRHGFSERKYERCVRKVKAKANPGKGGRRKVTMSLQKFAELVKRKGDPKLWQDFLRKVKGYRKWTHGTLPEKVTVEFVDKPGMSGLWVTYDAGRTPESTYVMPHGSKRKGAWKHPWDTMPRIKHDPESGIILQKLGGRSAITDFYHR